MVGVRRAAGPACPRPERDGGGRGEPSGPPVLRGWRGGKRHLSPWRGVWRHSSEGEAMGTPQPLPPVGLRPPGGTDGAGEGQPLPCPAPAPAPPRPPHRRCAPALSARGRAAARNPSQTGRLYYANGVLCQEACLRGVTLLGKLRRVTWKGMTAVGGSA